MHESQSKGGRRPGAGRKRGPETRVVRLPVPLADLARRLAERGILSGDVNAFLDVAGDKVQSVPLVGSSASCGFPSPADDYLDRPLDFNELLIANAAATFAVRIAGESMIGVGLFPNDIAVVDRSVEAYNGCIVLALLDGEFTIKTYHRKAGEVRLMPANRSFREIVVSEGSSFEIWGVVTKSIRMF